MTILDKYFKAIIPVFMTFFVLKSIFVNMTTTIIIKINHSTYVDKCTYDKR